MRSVIVGTDFLKDKNGDMKILEVNTNTGIHTSALDYLNWDEFELFLKNHGINEIVLLYGYENIVGTYYNGFHDRLEKFCNTIGIRYLEVFNPQYIGDVEDLDNRLILRLSYDGESLFDRMYATDKINFLKIIQGKKYAPNYYYHEYDGSEFNHDDLTDNYQNSDVIPTYISKKRFPTNKMKLYKPKDMNSLKDIKLQMDDLTYLQEFYHNKENFINNKISVIRTLDIVYDNLKVFHFGSYKTSGNIPNNQWDTVYDKDDMMYTYCFNMWLSKPHEWDSFNYFFDDNEQVLSFGETPFSLKFDWIDDIQNNFHPEMNTFTGDLNSTISSYVVPVGGYISREVGAPFIKIKTEQGEWEDLSSSVLFIKEGKTDEYKFKYVKDIVPNDYVVMYDSINRSTMLNKILSISLEFKVKKIYSIHSNLSHFFLPMKGTLNNYLIQYNPSGAKPV